jgi:hypothetical protein
VNGGLLSPDPSLLGDLAVATATLVYEEGQAERLTAVLTVVFFVLIVWADSPRPIPIGLEKCWLHAKPTGEQVGEDYFLIFDS